MLNKLPYILTFALFALLFSTCTNKSSEQDNDETHLYIGVMSSMDYLPLAVAQEYGFFEKEGISVDINKFYSANERDAAFQSENLDGTILDYTGAAIQRAGGINLKLTSQCDGSFVLIAGEESGVTTIPDLVDKRLAVSRNTVIDFCTDFLLQASNISPDYVEKVEINKIPLRLEMLRNGKIDATMLPDPFATIALQSGGKKIIDINDMDLRVTGIAFHDDVIATKEGAIKSFYRAYNQAIELINSKPSSDFNDLLVAEIGVPLELVGTIKLPKYTKAQLPQENDLQLVDKWLKTKELVPADFDINSLIATGLLP